MMAQQNVNAREKDFIANGKFSQVVEYLYEHRPSSLSENALISRVLRCMLSARDKQPEFSLEYETLLFYISKYGFYEENELLMLQSLLPDQNTDWSGFPEELKHLVSAYIRRQELSEKGQSLLETLRRTGRFNEPVLAFSSEERKYFNGKYIHQYVKCIRFVGICLLE